MRIEFESEEESRLIRRTVEHNDKGEFLKSRIPKERGKPRSSYRGQNAIKAVSGELVIHSTFRIDRDRGDRSVGYSE